MSKAKNGDKVKVHYTGKLQDGKSFDTSVGGDPMEFTLGDGRLIPGFESAVEGMTPGEKKSVTIPVDQAYGPRRDDLVLVIDRTDLPDDIDPSIGDQLELEQNNKSFVVNVVETSPDSITLDANHPLAGTDLMFEIELVEIV